MSQLNQTLELIELEIKKMSNLDYRYKTNCEFSFSPTTNNRNPHATFINLRIASLETLITIGAFLKNKKSDYTDFAEKNLKLLEYPAPKWNGNLIDDIISDITYIQSYKTYKEVYEGLIKQRDELKQFLSKDDLQKQAIEKAKIFINTIPNTKNLISDK